MKYPADNRAPLAFSSAALGVIIHTRRASANQLLLLAKKKKSIVSVHVSLGSRKGGARGSEHVSLGRAFALLYDFCALLYSITATIKPLLVYAVGHEPERMDQEVTRRQGYPKPA